MAYNVASLTNYTNEQNFPILKASILGAKTASLFTLQSGIKSSAALNIMNVTATLQSDAVGATTAGGGDVTFSQRMLSVAPICVREFLDPKTLNSKYTQSQLQAGSDDNELAFEQEIIDELVKGINMRNEVAIWQGDTGNGSSNLNQYNGYLKLIDGFAASATTTVTGATFTTANAVANIDALYAAIPVEVLDAEDMGVFMGRDYFRTYTTALKNANLFHYGADSVDGEITIPGTTIKIYAVNGLNSTKRVVAARKSNMFIGCDLESEEDSVDAVYLPETEKVKIKVAYKYGVQIAFPAEVSTLKITA